MPEDRTHTAPSRTGSDPVRTTGHGRHRLGSSRWRSSRGPPRMGLLPAARCSWASFRWGFSRGRLFSGRLIAAISSAPGLIHGALLWRGHFGPSRSIPPFPPTSNCGATGVWTRSDVVRRQALFSIWETMVHIISDLGHGAAPTDLIMKKKTKSESIGKRPSTPASV